MAKRKTPTAKSIRQGQTIWMVCDDSFIASDFRLARVQSIRIDSHKSEPHPPGEIVTRIPVHIARKGLAASHGSGIFFYSRRRAIARAREIDRINRVSR